MSWEKGVEKWFQAQEKISFQGRFSNRPKMSLLIRKLGSPLGLHWLVTDSGQIRGIQLLTVKSETKKPKFYKTRGRMIYSHFRSE